MPIYIVYFSLTIIKFLFIAKKICYPPPAAASLSFFSFLSFFCLLLLS